MQNETAKLEVQGLFKQFGSAEGGSRPILHDVNVKIAAGEFVCIVGASGCGKTTLIRILDGLIPPSAGCVRINGAAVSTPGPDRGFVFQQDSLLPWRSVLDNVVFGLEVLKRPRDEQVSVALDLIRLVGLAGHEKAYPHQLSGGMRQRVNLARALAIDPDVLLMDEPFAALDAQTREIMQRELQNIWERKRKTVIFITHQIDEAIYLADRVLVLGGQPGTVRDDIRIPLERPRDLDIKRRADFTALTERIWRLIQH
ncbi:MAG TPA: ABC transporter ATP-binding protein [Pseudolabrys sp.]|nr:ABC transporter ATP-binding protein [Pseudolabrys sp.]